MPVLSPEEAPMREPELLERRQAALIAYDVCRRALTPSDLARRAAMRSVLDAWVRMSAVARAAGVPVIYTTPVSRADGADVVMLPTDLSAETGVPPLTNAVEGTPDAGFPDDIAPRPEDYVFLKRRPSAFYGTGVAELLHMLWRDTIIIGGGATNRGVETSVREAFNLKMHHIDSLTGLAAKALAKQVGDIRLVVHDQDACATRGLPDGQAHAHDAASAIVVR